MTPGLCRAQSQLPAGSADCGGRCEELLLVEAATPVCGQNSSCMCRERGFGEAEETGLRGSSVPACKGCRWAGSVRAGVQSFLRGLCHCKRLFKHISGKGSQTCPRYPLCRTLCPGAVAHFVMCFCSDRCVWGAWAGPGCSIQRAEPKAAHTAGLCPSLSAGIITKFHLSVFYFGCSPHTFAPVSRPACVRPRGPNRASPALVEEHRQERERFPWKPLDAQQQVADSCHVTRCINQKCCMNQVRWGQSPARSPLRCAANY